MFDQKGLLHPPLPLQEMFPYTYGYCIDFSNTYARMSSDVVWIVESGHPFLQVIHQFIAMGWNINVPQVGLTVYKTTSLLNYPYCHYLFN